MMKSWVVAARSSQSQLYMAPPEPSPGQMLVWDESGASRFVSWECKAMKWTFVALGARVS